MENIQTGENSEALDSVALDPKHATTIHLAINNSDFVIVFGSILPIFGSEGLMAGGHLKPVSCISLTPSTAKQLMFALQEALHRFEATSGETVGTVGKIKNTLEVSNENT